MEALNTLIELSNKCSELTLRLRPTLLLLDDIFVSLDKYIQLIHFYAPL